jgi:hypothetical protein
MALNKAKVASQMHQSTDSKPSNSAESLILDKSAGNSSGFPILISGPQLHLRIGQEKMRNGEFSQSRKAFQEAYLAFEVCLYLMLCVIPV